MSIKTKSTLRSIRNIFLIWLALFLTGMIPIYIMAHGVENLPAVANAQPAPWWQQVESFQNLAIKWIGALTGITAALATFVGVLITQYKNLKERLDRVSDRTDTAVATAQAATIVQAANTATGLQITNSHP